MNPARELAICDLSARRKCGLKGPGAAAWLAENGIPVPPAANTWLPLGADGLIARLGETEFLLENAALPEDPPPRVYPVLREDTGIALAGERINEVLIETCSFDFARLDGRTQLVMTSMVGVSVVAIAQNHVIPIVRIWADPTFGPYLWKTLLAIATELGGGEVPPGELFKGV